MKDLVIGAVTNYNYDKIKYWVNSLDQSGYTGEKALLCYNVDYELANEVSKRNYKVFCFSKNDQLGRLEYRRHDSDRFSVVVERFLHLWYFLKSYKGQYRYIITTDVKDVVFQKNPSIWLEQNLDTSKHINASSESIRYRDETWGYNNILKSFGPIIQNHMKDNVINNCGVLSGRFDVMLDLFLNIYMMCNGTSHFIEGGGGPDQAALNILLNTESYKMITNFAKSEDGWAAQLGTTGSQISSKYSSLLVEKSPIIIGNEVCTSEGKPFTIVHQYDRISELKSIIEKKYE